MLLASSTFSLFESRIASHAREEDEGERGGAASEAGELAASPVATDTDVFQDGAGGVPQTAAAITSWQATGGLANIGGVAGDPQIAVSATSVVVTARDAIAFYDKSGELLVDPPISIRSFFAPLNLTNVSGTFDARAIFDPYRKRFVVGALVIPVNITINGMSVANNEAIGDRFALAISKTENPLDGWWLYWTPARLSTDAGNVLGDYPTLGVDASNIYTTHIGLTKTLNADGTLRRDNINAFLQALPAAALIDGPPAAGASALACSGFEDPDNGATLVVQAVMHHSASPSVAFFAQTGDCNGVNANTFFVWGMDDPPGLAGKLAANMVPTFDRAAVPVDRGLPCPGDANQPGAITTLWMGSALGNSVLKSVFRDGVMHAVSMGQNDWFGSGTQKPSIRYLTLDVASFPTVPPALTDRLFGGRAPDDAATDTVSYGWPTVEVNANGDAIVMYDRSGDVATTIFPEVRFSSVPAGETSLRASRLLKAGESAYLLSPPPDNRLGWSDLGGMSVDPYDGVAIWMAQQYGCTSSASGPSCPSVAADGTANNYTIWVGKAFGQQHPDFLVDGAVTAAPNPAAPGQTVAVSATIRNQGDGAATGGPEVAVFLVADPPNGTADVPLASTTLASIGAGERVAVTISGAVPMGTPTGFYRVKVVIDPNNAFAEYSETNNVAFGETNLRVEPGPPAVLTLAPASATNVVDTSHTVTATVTDAFGNAVPGIVVRFAVGGVNVGAAEPGSGSAVTGAGGAAAFSYVGRLAGNDVITAFADTNNDGVRQADPAAHEPQATASKTWLVPPSTPGKITGGGAIVDAASAEASFNLNPDKKDASSPLKGRVSYESGGAAARAVESTVLTALVVSGSSGTVFGTATINGSGAFSFRVDVVDMGEPGRSDTFRIRTSDGYDSAASPLIRGNIQVH